MKYLYLVPVLMLVITLAACGGGSRTMHSTSYLPPSTPEGRMCVNQCQQSRDFCVQSCDFDNRSCYNQVQIQAQHDYDTYARARYGEHATIDLFPSDFEHPQSCDAAKKSCVSDCESPYNACYHSCGGAVAVTSSCKFLCFE